MLYISQIRFGKQPYKYKIMSDEQPDTVLTKLKKIFPDFSFEKEKGEGIDFFGKALFSYSTAIDKGIFGKFYDSRFYEVAEKMIVGKKYRKLRKNWDLWEIPGPQG